jgi:HK97 family phage prohead protease
MNLMNDSIEKRATGRAVHVVPQTNGLNKSGREIEGAAALYYVPGDGGTEFTAWFGVERLVPGCFDVTVGRDDQRVLHNHDSTRLLGRVSSGTAKLWTDEDGLKYKVRLPRSPLGDEVLVSVTRGDLQGSSFAFFVNAVRLREEGDTVIREVLDTTVAEVSPVTWPAYEGTETKSADSKAPPCAIDGIRLERDVRTLTRQVDAIQRMVDKDSGKPGKGCPPVAEMLKRSREIEESLRVLTKLIERYDAQSNAAVGLTNVQRATRYAVTNRRYWELQ